MHHTCRNRDFPIFFFKVWVMQERLSWQRSAVFFHPSVSVFLSGGFSSWWSFLRLVRLRRSALPILPGEVTPAADFMQQPPPYSKLPPSCLGGITPFTASERIVCTCGSDGQCVRVHSCQATQTPRAHWNSISHFRLVSALLLFVFCLTVFFAERSCLVFCIVLHYQISLWHVPALPGENDAVSVLLKWNRAAHKNFNEINTSFFWFILCNNPQASSACFDLYFFTLPSLWWWSYNSKIPITLKCVFQTAMSIYVAYQLSAQSFGLHSVELRTENQVQTQSHDFVNCVLCCFVFCRVTTIRGNIQVPPLYGFLSHSVTRLHDVTNATMGNSSK